MCAKVDCCLREVSANTVLKVGELTGVSTSCAGQELVGLFGADNSRGNQA